MGPVSCCRSLAQSAAAVFVAATLFVALFQLALAAGAPWGELTWGGRFRGRLPARMRLLALISCALLVAFATVVVARAGIALADWRGFARPAIWAVVAYCALGVVANAATPSRKERRLWLPVVALMLLCSLVVALS